MKLNRKIILEEYNLKKQKLDTDHLMIFQHKVMDLEQIASIKVDNVEFADFETWVCFNRKCNYLEYRLKEGHREDR